MNILKNRSTICLNMIVKNEAHVILETLNNLTSVISFDYWVISDTGSTDNTKEIIQTFFKEKNIPGELVEHEWKDFGYNRTKALECAFNKTDYLFVFDADDSIVGKLVIPKILVNDRYDFLFGSGFTYLRPLLVNNRIKWKYVGVLHEYLSSEFVETYSVLNGDYYIHSGKTGDRNKDPDKYYKDAIVIQNAFEKEQDYGLKTRYAFYCAQSYRDAGYTEETLQWYLKCVEMNGWAQEKFFSCIMIGNIYKEKKDMNNAYKFWLKTVEYDSERMDGVIIASNNMVTSGNYIMCNLLYNKYKNYKKNLKEKLFLFDYLYNGQFEFDNSIAAFYSNDLDGGYECCKKILNEKTLPYGQLIATLNNLLFYKKCLELDHDNVELLNNIAKIFNEMQKKREQIPDSYIELWNIIWNNNTKKLCKFKKTTFKNSSSPKIFMSFTTCKRFDLFTKTMNSILNQWTDIEKVDYWFCVDDNSTEDDRVNMKKLYGWVDYYMKNLDEKGHMKSMNIIWNKIKELKPTYWIHMEDDFIFFEKMNYIEKAIEGLETLKSNNVKQVLFNINYSEIIKDYNNHGHIHLNNNFALQDYKEGHFPYLNCHYWPHFSFRPSMIDVDCILKMGDFYTDLPFFERQYADKWFNIGNRSAFFDKITNIHIGRLTSEISNPYKINAYRLNNENQFTDRDVVPNITCNENISLDIQEIKKNILDINYIIKVINLTKRLDRKNQTIENFMKEKIENYEFVEAVDGFTIEPSLEIKNLFKENDFGYRKGVIGCALTHLQLWKELLNDEINDYYVIMEDDCTLINDFKIVLDSILSNLQNTNMILFGYHMLNQNRKKYNELYNGNKDYSIVPINNDIFLGGTFGYYINKVAAKKIIDHIEVNGIKHGIDYMFKIIPDFIKDVYEVQPQIVFSTWNENNKNLDTDIQNNFEAMDFSNISLPSILSFYQTDRKNYSSLYENVLKSDKNEVLNIMDLTTDKKNLFVWREYFINACIYSINNYEGSNFNEDRIKIFKGIVNNNNIYIYNLLENLHIYFDLIIDDCKEGFKKTMDNFIVIEKYLLIFGTYIIENINDDDVHSFINATYFSTEYQCYLNDKYDIKNYILNNNNILIFKLKNNYKNNPFVFIQNLDIDGNDICYMQGSLSKLIRNAVNKVDCDGFNTLGFLKKEIDVNKFTTSPYFGEKDGIFIKKNLYERQVGRNKALKFINSFIDKEKIQEICKKRYCFIHSCIKKEIGTVILDNLINRLTSSNLINELDNIFIINTGVPIEIQHFSNEKIKIIHFSDDILLAENVTINIIHSFSEQNPDCDILYLHTKGITHFLNEENYKKVKDWIDLMLHFLVNNHLFCFELLNNYNCLGCNYNDQENKHHFSGNFWWSNTNYLKTLKKVSENYSEMNFYLHRHESEQWLLSNMQEAKHYCLFYSNINHYELLFPQEKYNYYNYDLLKKEYDLQKKNKKFRVKLICNWDTSETVCKEWSDMCENNFTWKNIEITWKNINIDYYVIINKPLYNDYYDPSKTIIFQMEPWVKDEKCNWGVKTWGEWSIPDEKKFLSVNSRKNNTHNNAFWQLGLKLPQLLDFKFEKTNKISSICSSKYFDPGHILRIDLLKYIEEKNDLTIDIYNKDNSLKWRNYKFPVTPHKDKYKGIVNYKYYFMMENNFEENFITEKIWEPILCECLVFYYGCPNVSKYINPLAYVELDITDFEKCYQTIKQAIEEDWWSQRIDIIRQEKEKILNELAFFPRIQKIIEDNERIKKDNAN
jgi:GR25 family glycosyltransferase involved in LPS biosynthesis